MRAGHDGGARVDLSQRIALSKRLSAASKGTGRLTISLGPEQAEWLQSLFAYDPETEVLAREHFLTRVGTEWARMVRTGCDVSLIVVGLQDFGPLAGMPDTPERSRRLRTIVDALSRQLRAWGDTLGRLDTFEFAILLPETGEKGLRELVRRIRPALEQALRAATPEQDEGVPVSRMHLGWITMHGCDAGFGWKWALDAARTRKPDDLRGAEAPVATDSH